MRASRVVIVGLLGFCAAADASPPPADGPAAPPGAPRAGRRGIVGRVVDGATGAPLPGALLDWIGDGEKEASSGTFDVSSDPSAEARGLTRSAADGRFELALPTPGTTSLRARHPEHPTRVVPAAERSTAGDTATGLVVAMRRGAVVEGVVAVSRDGGAEGAAPPVRGVVLAEAAFGGETRTIAVGEDGRFRIGGVSEGAVFVAFLPPEIRSGETGGLLVASHKVDVVAGAANAHRVELATSLGGVVEVTVRRGGGPCDATVSFGGARGPDAWFAAAGEPGRYRCRRAVRRGPHELLVRRDYGPFVRRPIEVVAGRRTDVAVEIPMGELRGVVRLPGDVRRTRIELRVERGSERVDTVWTDEEGAFVFRDLAAGAYRVLLAPRSRADGDDEDTRKVVSVHSEAVEVVLGDGEEREVAFDPQLAGAATVTIVDPLGRPLPGVPVTLSREDAPPEDLEARWSRWFETGGTTGRDGSVRIRGLGEGRWVAFADELETAAAPSAPFRIAPGVEAKVSIPTRATDRVRVLFDAVDATGQGRSDVRFEVARGDDPPMACRRPHVRGAATAFAILPPGPYVLVVRAGPQRVESRHPFEVAGPSPQRVKVVLER